MGEETEVEFGYEDFLELLSDEGFEVEPAAFGGFKVSKYTTRERRKKYVTSAEDLLEFIASIYAIQIKIGE